jgi:hypothetical protein
VQEEGAQTTAYLLFADVDHDCVRLSGCSKASRSADSTVRQARLRIEA